MGSHVIKLSPLVPRPQITESLWFLVLFPCLTPSLLHYKVKTRPESSLEHLRLFGILRQRKTLCCSLREGKLTRETLVVQEKQKVECRNNQEKQTNKQQQHINHQKSHKTSEIQRCCQHRKWAGWLRRCQVLGTSEVGVQGALVKAVWVLHSF